FDTPLRTAAVVGDNVVVGSSIRLLAELRELNARTWNAGDSQIAEWREHFAKLGAPLEVSARFAFSIFYGLAQRSVAARLPMKLHCCRSTAGAGQPNGSRIGELVLCPLVPTRIALRPFPIHQLAHSFAFSRRPGQPLPPF